MRRLCVASIIRRPVSYTHLAAYCVVSIALSRIFLKEKLPGKQYASVAIVIVGIILMGIAEGLAE